MNEEELEIFSRQLILKDFDDKSFKKLQSKKNLSFIRGSPQRDVSK